MKVTTADHIKNEYTRGEALLRILDTLSDEALVALHYLTPNFNSSDISFSDWAGAMLALRGKLDLRTGSIDVRMEEEEFQKWHALLTDDVHELRCALGIEFLAETEAREEKRLEEERHDPVYQAQLAESRRKFIAEHGLNLKPEPKSKEWYELDDDPDHEAEAVRLGARLEAQHARIAEHAAAEMERLENEYLRLYQEGAVKPIDTDAVRAQFRDFIRTILEKASSDDAASQQALDAAHAQLYGKDNFTIALVVGSLPEVPAPGSDEEDLRSSLLGELETRGALEEDFLNGNYFSSGETTLLRYLHPSLKFKAAA